MRFLLAAPRLESSPAYLSGILIGALMAGVVAGLLPMAVALYRKRPGRAVANMAICIFLGLLGGIVAAGPVALVLALLTMLGRRGDEPAPRGLFGLAPGPLPTATPAYYVPTLAPAVAAPNGAAPTQPMYATAPNGTPAIACPACAALIPPSGDRMPPWCPRCGSDLKAAPRPA